MKLIIWLLLVNMILMSVMSVSSLIRRQGCLTKEYCQSQPSQKCTCNSGEYCVFTARTCTQCPSERCIEKSKEEIEASKQQDVAIIASCSVAAVIILIIILGIVYYIRNKRDIQKQGGIYNHVRYCANRDSIIMMTGDEDVELLNKRLSLLSMNPDDVRHSILLTTKKHNFDTERQKPKVIQAERELNELFESGNNNTMSTVIEIKENNRVSMPTFKKSNGSTRSNILIAPTHFNASAEIDDDQNVDRRASVATFKTEILENPFNINDNESETIK